MVIRMNIFSSESLNQRQQQADSLAKSLKESNVEFAQIEIPDNNGTLRGKLCYLEKSLSPSGTGMQTLTLSARSGDQLCMTPFSNMDNGFPKMVAVPDYNTLRRWSWRDNMASILCDFYMEDGTPCTIDPRHILKSLIDEYSRLGIEPRFALEFEVYMFHNCSAALSEARYLDLKPWGNGWDFYSVTRYPSHEFERFGKDLLSRFSSVGIDIEAFHTEYGKGMYEFPISHCDALTAADNAIRAKTYFKQLCHDYELVPSFMAAINTDSEESMTGCHHNLSLWRDSKNLFWDEKHQCLSEIGRQFSAGVLQTMPDFHMLFRPWVNSYRRMDAEKWSPTNASWGLDNHTAALRVVHGPLPGKNTRLEHRLAGTDINPYLSIAAILAGGLHGIKNQLEPPAYAKGNAGENQQFEYLSQNLYDATQIFRQSDITQEYLGEKAVDHFARIKDAEWAEFQQWAQANHYDMTSKQVSRWEIEQYFLWC